MPAVGQGRAATSPRDVGESAPAASASWRRSRGCGYCASVERRVMLPPIHTPATATIDAPIGARILATSAQLVATDPRFLSSASSPGSAPGSSWLLLRPAKERRNDQDEAATAENRSSNWLPLITEKNASSNSHRGEQECKPHPRPCKNILAPIGTL